jgi:hypothetical protein
VGRRKWRNWEPLGAEKILLSPGAAASSGHNRIDVFVHGTDDTLYTKSWDGNVWSGYSQLGTEKIASSPAAVSWGPNRLDVFVRGTDNTLYTKSWDGHAWSGYSQLGTEKIASSPAAVSWGPNRLDVFVRGTDNTLYTKSWDGHAWSNYAQLGTNTFVSDPAAASWGPNRIDAFVRGTDDNLYTRSWDGNAWSDYQSLGQPSISVRCLPNIQWTNYERTKSITPLSTCTPQNVYDVVSIVRNAEANHKQVHAYGSAWSFSDCAMTPDVLVDTHLLSNEIQTVQRAFNGNEPPNVYHVEAGITIHQLYLNLDGKNPRLALETMGGASGQTLAGAISTGTHGGDLFMPPIADSVLAIHLVGAGGVQYWVEPTAAITTKASLHQFVGPGITLENIVYDDDWFNAVLVSVGCMGIIYAVVLRVRPQYNLIETTTATTWQSFKQSAAAQLNDRTNRFLQVAVNPYTDGNGNNFALVTTRHEGDITGLRPIQPPTDGVIRALIKLVGDLLSANPIDTLQLVGKTLLQLLQTGDIANIANSGPRLLIQLINNILTDATELRSVLATDYSNIMAAAWAPGTVGGISYKVMDTNRYRPSLGPSDVDPPRLDNTGGYSMEIFLPTQEIGTIPPAPYFVGFVDNLIKRVNAATDTFLVGYVGIRFMGQTRAFLGMQQWPQTCSVEISTLPDVRGEASLLAAILDDIYLAPIGGPFPVPHWGQWLDLHMQGYGDRYPNYEKWQKVYAALSNNFTVRTFENALSSRWQLTFPRLLMSVDVKFLGSTVENLVTRFPIPIITIQVTVNDKATNAPVEGATVTVFDEDFTPPVEKRSGVTGANGTVQFTYPSCLDPETKTPMECSGRVRKERYQDEYFITPFK